MSLNASASLVTTVTVTHHRRCGSLDLTRCSTRPYILGGFSFIPFIVLGGLAFTFFYCRASDTPSVEPCVIFNAIPVNCDEASHINVSTLKACLTVRRTFEASPRTSHTFVPYYAILKGAISYLDEDEAMSECAAPIDVTRKQTAVMDDHEKKRVTITIICFFEIASYYHIHSVLFCIRSLST